MATQPTTIITTSPSTVIITPSATSIPSASTIAPQVFETVPTECISGGGSKLGNFDPPLFQ